MERRIFFYLKVLVFFLLFFCSTNKHLMADSVELKIDDVSKLNSPWPMVASIPFPSGELKDVANIRIMKGNREVPSQVDVAATWQDGSVRWALAGFTDSPQGKYKVEFGQGVKRRSYPSPLKVVRQEDGRFRVDTGVAVYQFDKDKLLPDEGWIIYGKEKRQILKNSGAGAYLVDNKGRTATVAGELAEIENTFLKEGPARVVVKRSGWYVTNSGEKLAKAELWLYYSAGVPYVKITHSITFTENTNNVWFKDYGLEFKTPEKPTDIYCSIGEKSEQIKKIENVGDEAYMLQAEYPHFLEREYKAVIGSFSGGEDKIIEEIQTVGDWAHGDYGNFGITLAMPFLAERYPKELSFGKRGARAVFWSGRSGKELDFRISSMVKDYWQSWAPGYPTPNESVLSRPSNAQGGSRTHDIWFLPVAGAYKEETVKQLALASTKQVLVLAKPEWVCSTEAFGCPMLHKDTKNFPAEENLLSEYWQRILLPLKAFPMNGFMSWGCFPSRSYHETKGKPLAYMNTIESLRDYGLRREPWRLYARSGERTYYHWGHSFSRFTGDWYVAHCDAPEKMMGGFISSRSYGGKYPSLPVFWGDNTTAYINAGVIDNWLFEYYLTGDERSLDIVYKIKEAFVKIKWNVRPSETAIKAFITLSMLDWNEDAMKTAKNMVYSVIDMENQNGLRAGGYGPLYKDHRTSFALAEYYLQTGDELAKEAILKLLDQRYRFDRRYRPAGHKNHDLFMHSLAYWLTGEDKNRYVVEQTLQDALYYQSVYPLSEDLKSKPDNIFDWPNLYIQPMFPGPRRSVYLGQHEFHNPFIGIPTALKLLSKEGRTGKRVPFVIKSMSFNPAKALVKHTSGQDTVISFYYTTMRKDIKPEVFKYPETEGAKPLKDVKLTIEKRVQWPERVLLRPDDIFHSYITIPKNVSSGLYLISLGGDEPFTLLDTSNGLGALYCPEGFWSSNGSPIVRKGEGAFGRAGEGVSIYFRVPEKLDTLKIFIERSARIVRPDGSVAIDWLDEKIGTQEIPCKGYAGIWRLDPYIHGFSGFCPPSFYRLLNVEPIVSFGSPDLLPTGTTGKPVVISKGLPAPTESLEFVKGVDGQGVRLSSGKTLTFTKGVPISDGYTFLPVTKGTVEFWYMPATTTYEVPIKMTQAIIESFFKAPNIHLKHIYEVRGSQSTVDSNLRIDLISTAKTSPVGYQSQHVFRAGRWTHLTFTWDLRQVGTKMEGEINIFVDGKKMDFMSGSFQIPTRLDKSRPFSLEEKGEEVVIGPFDGVIDNLRVSDNVRYIEDFVPSKKASVMDKNTRGLFLFNGTLEGASSFSKDVMIMK